MDGLIFSLLPGDSDHYCIDKTIHYTCLTLVFATIIIRSGCYACRSSSQPCAHVALFLYYCIWSRASLESHGIALCSESAAALFRSLRVWDHSDISNGTPKQRSRHKQTTSLGLRRMLLFANFVGPCSAEDSILYFYVDLLHPMPESAVG